VSFSSQSQNPQRIKRTIFFYPITTGRGLPLCRPFPVCERTAAGQVTEELLIFVVYSQPTIFLKTYFQIENQTNCIFYFFYMNCLELINNSFLCVSHTNPEGLLQHESRQHQGGSYRGVQGLR